MKGEYANEISKTSVKQIIYFYPLSECLHFWRRLCDRYTHEKKFVDQYHWIDDEEMLDLIAIAQSSPGAIAVNGAIVVGYKLAGIPGVLLCVLATVLPPFVIISILSVFYAAFQSNVWIRLLLEGMQSGVAAVIASVVYDMGRGIIREKTPISLLIMGGAFLANYMFQINAVYIILFCIALGYLQTWYQKRRTLS